MRTREHEADSDVNLSELAEIELLILKRMREYTIGDHRSLFHGTGFDFVGLRDWTPGDRLSAIDWAQSSLTNFSPLIVREFEQPSTAPVIVVADRSRSTRCGVDGVPISTAIARAIGTIGLSAVFFQDVFGLITFDDGFEHLEAVRPRVGKSHVSHCLDAYHGAADMLELKAAGSLGGTIGGFMRKTSLIPVISDFLFDDYDDVLRELALLNSAHDVFLVLIDSAFAFETPPTPGGWVETFDVETGRSRMLSRRSLLTLAAQIRGWQDDVERAAKGRDLDVLRMGRDDLQTAIAASEFIAERRLRKG